MLHISAFCYVSQLILFTFLWLFIIKEFSFDRTKNILTGYGEILFSDSFKLEMSIFEMRDPLVPWRLGNYNDKWSVYHNYNDKLSVYHNYNDKLSVYHNYNNKLSVNLIRSYKNGVVGKRTMVSFYDLQTCFNWKFIFRIS